MPPRLKMALLTWIAVWPVSMLVPAILMPLLGPNSPQVLTAGLIAAGIVVILGRHAFAGQSRAPLATRMNEGAK
jgi:antibiotic biosynthesis monooxygenase (ABM) superfamily enzyme